MAMFSLLDGSTPITKEIDNIPLTRSEEIDGSRSRALLIADANTVTQQAQEKLIVLQQTLQHGATYGLWETPRKWSKTQSGEAAMKVDMGKRIIHFLPHELKSLRTSSNLNPTEEQLRVRVENLVEGAILALTRYLLLLRMGPSGLGKRGRSKSLDPNTVRAVAYSFGPQMLGLCITKIVGSGLPLPPGTEVKYFNVLEEADFEQLSTSSRDNIVLEAGRMHRLAQQGCWQDVPQMGLSRDLITRVAGPSKEKAEPRTRNPHLPLPDEFVSEMGAKSNWLIMDLAPNIFSIGNTVQSIWSYKGETSSTPDQLMRHRKNAVTSFLQSYVWRDRMGVPFERPPFAIRLTQHGKKRSKEGDKTKLKAPDNVESKGATLLSWPPRTFGEVMGLMHNVQLAHLFVVGMSTAGRISELVDMRRDCVKVERNELTYARGHTFKLVESHDGEFRDWVLPDIGVIAIEQQVRLVQCAEAIGPMSAKPKFSRENDGMHLWAQIGGFSKSVRTAPLIDLNRALTSYARALEMTLTPGGQAFRSHRFRKTVARLVALAITQAPKVLMDVFGHKSIEMTLYYILADKDLRIEIEQVSRELRIMRAKDTIEEMLATEASTTARHFSSTFGGPSASIIQNAIVEQKARVHRRGEEWGAKSVTELAEILTLQGKAWQYVRPGVICTKFPGTESGPCNKSRGHPEPARCQTHCKHRLEEPFLRDDVDGAIRDCIKEYQKAEQNGEDLIADFWGAQIRIHLNRFKDLRAKWIANPVVNKVVGTLKEAE